MESLLQRQDAADDASYLAIQTRDPRFDGRLFVGVTSTRVYCRPVCRVRIPMRRHCRFFGNAASAEAAGFRPCRRCRPELAPGVSLVDSPHTLAMHAASTLSRAARDGEAMSMPMLARRLGVTDRHLRRIFIDVHGVSPLAFLTTQRLLFAKHLLSDTALPVTQVAMLCGFGSLRRFNDAFAKHYRLAPTDLRKRNPDVPLHEAEGITLRLAYRPPYDIDGTLRFLATRALPGIEHVDLTARCVRRALAVEAAEGSHAGWISASFEPGRDQLRLTMSASLLPVIGRVIDIVRQALDLDAEPLAMSDLLATVPAAAVEGLRVPGSFDPFETAVRIVLGQQVSVAAARTLALRVVERFSATPLEHGLPRFVMRSFPSAKTLALATEDELGSLGIVRTRSRAIMALAQAVHEGHLRLDRSVAMETTLDALRAIRGIGEWTAQLVAMRVLAWPDAFAASDIGVLNALGHRDAKLAEEQSQAWKPWRSYAMVQLWRSLETGT